MSDGHPFELYDPHCCSRVGFDCSVRIYYVESHRDYTDKERSDSWYSAHEFERSIREVRKTVRYMRCQLKTARRGGAYANDKTSTPARGGEEEEGTFCTRGLDHLKSSAHVEQRRINRDCAIQGVLGEQDRQRRARGDCPLILDVEELRRASERGSEWARNHARTIGRKDERDARIILVEDWRKAKASMRSCLSLADNSRQRAPHLARNEHLPPRS